MASIPLANLQQLSPFLVVGLLAMPILAPFALWLWLRAIGFAVAPAASSARDGVLLFSMGPGGTGGAPKWGSYSPPPPGPPSGGGGAGIVLAIVGAVLLVVLLGCGGLVAMFFFRVRAVQSEVEAVMAAEAQAAAQQAAAQQGMPPMAPPGMEGSVPMTVERPPPISNPTGAPVGAGDALAPGDKVLVEWGGAWHQGEVLEALPDGTVKIHYVGWDANWDEAVPRSRLRRPEGS
jgi:hypothetical protein